MVGAAYAQIIMPGTVQQTNTTPTNWGNQQNQTGQQTNTNTGNVNAMNALLQLLTMLTGQENWGTVAVIGPVNQTTSVTTSQTQTTF
jgi:hypothetical protein